MFNVRLIVSKIKIRIDICNIETLLAQKWVYRTTVRAIMLAFPEFYLYILKYIWIVIPLQNKFRFVSKAHVIVNPIRSYFLLIWIVKVLSSTSLKRQRSFLFNSDRVSWLICFVWIVVVYNIGCIVTYFRIKGSPNSKRDVESVLTWFKCRFRT